MQVLRDWILQNFYLLQIFGGVGLVLVFWWVARPKENESQFRVREADRKDRKPITAESLADAKLKPSRPLELTGIRIDRPAHEILGVPVNATASQIRSAHRELMKRYHPDQVARPGTQAWNDATRIAEALNQAKEELLRRNSKT